MQTYHLIPEGEQWTLTGEESDRALSQFRSREEAVEECTRLVHDAGGSLKIHLPDGTIEEERTYRAVPDQVAA